MPKRGVEPLNYATQARKRWPVLPRVLLAAAVALLLLFVVSLGVIFLMIRLSVLTP